MFVFLYVFAEVSKKLPKIQMPKTNTILIQMSWNLVCRSLSWGWIELYKKVRKINFYMVSPFQGAPIHHFRNSLVLKALFSKIEEFWIFFFIFHILIISCSCVQNFRVITLFNLETFNFECFLTYKRPISQL